ncbi:Uncharacterised protein [Aeromonas hydrophila]|nr:Uncharacterised protein [Aeromonas hydrophila]
MIKLNNPNYDFEEAIDECIYGIVGNDELRYKVINNKPALIDFGNQYSKVAGIGKLYSIAPINTDVENDPNVIDTLKKSDLVKLYDQYFVPENKAARKIYDSLLNSAQEKCPFCGGIGTPRNLDHFLPKAHFPQFSVLPYNLVPSCRDCNMDGKAQSFAIKPDEQIIQPYVDNPRFFIEQWIYCEYSIEDNDEIGVFNYFTNPPEIWDPIDKNRVIKHFCDFNLAKRYSTKAAEQLGIIRMQIRKMQESHLPSDAIINILLQPGVDAAPFPNHWQKSMYQALINYYHP